MTPNKELCSQVLRMAREVCDDLHMRANRMITIDTLGSFNGVWPYAAGLSVCPHIIVCTPAYIGNYIRGPNILDEALFRNVRCVVLDEADMVLEGSYQQEVERIMDAFKLTRRQMIRNGEAEVHSSVVQNILAAATLPSYGKKSTEKYIEKRFPEAIKVSNLHLHKHHPRIKQCYIELRGEAHRFGSPAHINGIVTALKTDESEKGTMIFANTANKAAELSSLLRGKGVTCAEFHKLLRPADRAQELNAFQNGEVFSYFLFSFLFFLFPVFLVLFSFLASAG